MEKLNPYIKRVFAEINVLKLGGENPNFNKGGQVNDDYILEMRNITKDFPGVRALDNVNFKVEEYTVLLARTGPGNPL